MLWCLREEGSRGRRFGGGVVFLKIMCFRMLWGWSWVEWVGFGEGVCLEEVV